MTQEEVQLVMIDLSARVMYHPKIQVHEQCLNQTYNEVLTCANFTQFSNIRYKIKPYLRPLSSMTKNEYEEFKKLDKKSMHRCTVQNGIDLWFDRWEIIEWFNTHHFDYRNLIKKDLALEAPIDMYNS